MIRYLVDRLPEANGYHKVHREGCPSSPAEISSVDLGPFTSSFHALKSARARYPLCVCCDECCNTDVIENF
jgi:hypothetical protein